MAQRRFKRICILTEALEPHPIGATIFAPFVATGLGGTPDAGTQTTEFAVTLENIGTAGTRTHRLSLQWQGATALPQPYSIQEYVITEWAACGIACAVLWHYTELRVIDTAKRGQGFDYWVKGETQEQGLEVSGILSEDAGEMQRRHREKREQLFSSLMVGGYVVIVGLARREIIVSYHAPQEAGR